MVCITSAARPDCRSTVRGITQVPASSFEVSSTPRALKGGGDTLLAPSVTPLVAVSAEFVSPAMVAKPPSPGVIR